MVSRCFDHSPWEAYIAARESRVYTTERANVGERRKRNRKMISRSGKERGQLFFVWRNEIDKLDGISLFLRIERKKLDANCVIYGSRNYRIRTTFDPLTRWRTFNRSFADFIRAIVRKTKGKIDLLAWPIFIDRWETDRPRSILPMVDFLTPRRISPSTSNIVALLCKASNSLDRR